MNLTIPKWLAFQTYMYGTEDSRTFISNERKHEYVLLEGLSSDLWKVISDTEDYNKVQIWSKEKGLIEELDDFIEQLKAQDLILNDNISYRAKRVLENLAQKGYGRIIKASNGVKFVFYGC